MKVHVTEGSVHVSYVDVLYESPEIIILDIGTVETNPLPFRYVPGRNVALQQLGRPGEDLTEITFEFERGVSHWDQAVNAVDEHAVQVIIWRRPQPEGVVTIYQGAM